MVDSNGSPDAPQTDIKLVILSVAALVWYVAMWIIGLTGCLAAYACLPASANSLGSYTIAVGSGID
jgi:hypothetical protein